MKPETGDTWTIGYATTFNDRTDFGINYFESDLKDAIYWDYYVTGTVVNLNKQNKRGLEVSLNHELNDNVSVNASYTYLQVEDYKYGGYVRDKNYSPNVYRIGVNYKDGKWDSNVWLRYTNGCDMGDAWYFMSSLPQVRYLDNSYLTVDMAVKYKASDNLSIYAKAYNLFNEAYTDYVGSINGSYTSPAQSRRFIIGAEYKF